MDDLRERLDSALTEEGAEREPDLARVASRGRHLRRRRLVGAALSSVAILAFLGLGTVTLTADGSDRPPASGASRDSQNEGTSGGSDWIPAADGAITTGGYVFSELEMQVSPKVDTIPIMRRLALRGRLGFVDGYPGKQTCTWEVFDDAGGLLGSATNTFMAAGPRRGMIKDRIDFDGDEPAYVDIRCDGKRLDDPRGEMRISDIGFKQDYDSKTGPGGVQVMFTYRWEGEGDPVPLTCRVQVFGPEGRSLIRTSRGLIASGPGPGRGSFSIREIEMEQDPTSATIDCAPME